MWRSQCPYDPMSSTTYLLSSVFSRLFCFDRWIVVHFDNSDSLNDYSFHTNGCVLVIEVVFGVAYPFFTISIFNTVLLLLSLVVIWRCSKCSFSYFHWSMIIKIMNNLIVQKDVEDWFCFVTLKRFPMLWQINCTCNCERNHWG